MSKATILLLLTLLGCTATQGTENKPYGTSSCSSGGSAVGGSAAGSTPMGGGGAGGGGGIAAGSGGASDAGAAGAAGAGGSLEDPLQCWDFTDAHDVLCPGHDQVWPWYCTEKPWDECILSGEQWYTPYDTWCCYEACAPAPRFSDACAPQEMTYFCYTASTGAWPSLVCTAAAPEYPGAVCCP
jgi:hypothetical protein